MSSQPGFGPVFGEPERQYEKVPYEDREELGEREIQDHDREDQEVDNPELASNEAQATGKVCARCGRVITASEDARLVGDGQWIHEACPL